MKIRIKDIREDKDLTQKAIAQILGIQQNSYSQIENGTNNIQIDHLVNMN